MKEHWKLSKETLLSVEEGQSQEDLKRIRSAATENKCNCGTLIRIAKLVLYLELILLLAGSCVVLWQTYYSQPSKISVPAIATPIPSNEVTEKSPLSEDISHEESTTVSSTEQNVSSNNKEEIIASDLPVALDVTTPNEDSYSKSNIQFDLTTVANTEISTQTITMEFPETWSTGKSEESQESKFSSSSIQEDESKLNEAVLDWGFAPFSLFFGKRSDLPTSNANLVESVGKTTESESMETSKSENDEKGSVSNSFEEKDKFDDQIKSSEQQSEENYYTGENIIKLIEAMEDPANFMIVENSGTQRMKFPSWYEELFLQQRKKHKFNEDYAEFDKSIGINSAESTSSTEEENNSSKQRTHHINWISFTSPQQFESQKMLTKMGDSEKEFLESLNSKKIDKESKIDLDFYDEFYDDEYWRDDYFDSSYRRWRRSLSDNDRNAPEHPINIEETTVSYRKDMKSDTMEKHEILKPPHLDSDESDTKKFLDRLISSHLSKYEIRKRYVERLCKLIDTEAPLRCFYRFF